MDPDHPSPAGDHGQHEPLDPNHRQTGQTEDYGYLRALLLREINRPTPNDTGTEANLSLPRNPSAGIYRHLLHYPQAGAPPFPDPSRQEFQLPHPQAPEAANQVQDLFLPPGSNQQVGYQQTALQPYPSAPLPPKTLKPIPDSIWQLVQQVKAVETGFSGFPIRYKLATLSEHFTSAGRIRKRSPLSSFAYDERLFDKDDWDYLMPAGSAAKTGT